MIRKMTLNDDINKIADLVYKTDDFIFPFIFGKQEKAIPIIAELIKLKNNDFSYTHIFCMESSGVQGILIGYDPKEIISKKENRDFLQLYNMWGIIKLIKKGFIIEPVLDKKNIQGLYIQNVCVDEKYRGKGIGSSLIDYFFEYGINNSYKSVFLDVGIKNETAKRLYEKKGFQEVSRKMIHSINDGFIRMEKRL